MGTTWRLVLLVLFLLGATPGDASATPPLGPAFQELTHRAAYVQEPGQGLFAVADLDQDGVRDLVFGAVSQNPVLFVLGLQSNGALGIKQSVIYPGPPDTGDRFVRVLAWRRAPGNSIVAVDTAGKASIFAGKPLTELDSFSVITDAVSAAIGDVDGNGTDDLLVLTPDHLYAYEMADGAPEWNIAVDAGYDIAVAQLDQDPALEIILAGPGFGLVIDGATRLTDWSYSDGFGVKLSTGEFTVDGSVRWVGEDAPSQFTVFGSEPWAPQWSHVTDNGISAIACGDLDGQGVDSIVYGEYGSGNVHAVDAATHQEQLAILNHDISVSAIAVGDLNHDEHADIVFASEVYDQSDPALRVTDSVTGQTLWSFVPERTDFRKAAVGDVDGDGRDEIVAVAGRLNTDSFISIFDAESGLREWTSPVPATPPNDPFDIVVFDLALLPRVGGPGMDIALGGRTAYYGRLVVLDGVNKSVVLDAGVTPSGPLWPERDVVKIAATDYDNDGITDYLLGLQPAGSGASGSKLFVVSGSNGEALWQSVAMGSGFSSINNVIVIPPEGNAQASELVAVLPASLRAYNSDTQLLDWTLSAENDGAEYIHDGVLSPELMLYQHSGSVSFYDAATLDYLRAFTLPTTLAGIVPLHGNAHTLLAASYDRLKFVDGADGSVLASSVPIGTIDPYNPHSYPAIAPLGLQSWRVAITSPSALWSMRLDERDRIFTDTFDTD